MNKRRIVELESSIVVKYSNIKSFLLNFVHYYQKSTESENVFC